MKLSLRYVFSKILMHSAFLNLSGMLFYRGAFVLLGVVVARTNELNNYGVFSVVMLYATTLVAVLGGALMSATTRTFAGISQSINKELCVKYVFGVGVFSFCVGALVFFSIDLIASSMPDKIYASKLLRVAIPFIVLSLILSAVQGILNAYQLFSEIASCQIFFAVVVCVGFFFINDIESLIELFSIATLLSLAMMFIYVFWSKVKCLFILDNCDDPQNFWVPITSSFIQLFFAALVVAPAHFICASMLYKSTSSADEVALFTTGVQWFAAASFIPIALSNVVYPDQIKKWLVKSKVELQKELKNHILRNLKIMLFVVVLLSVCSPLLVVVYQFPQKHSWLVFLCVFISSAFMAIQLPAANQLLAAGKFSIGLMLNCVWFLMYLSIAYCLPGGALCSALALLIAYMMHSVFTVGYVFKFLLTR